MGSNSSIEWTKHTWNPWVGCFKVSPGCKNCYMYREQNHYGNDPKEIRRTKPATFTKPLFWAEKDPGLVFTSSWTDFFLPEADPQWRADAWDIIRNTPQNTYQILTKRIENVPEMLPDDWGQGWPHVWLGVSVENQEMADLRIPQLIRIPARIRFLSIEPLIAPVDLHIAWLNYNATVPGDNSLWDGVDWVIVGGESGLAAHARPMHPKWASAIQHQCELFQLPFFFKQWGQWAPGPVTKPDGRSRVLFRDGIFTDVNWATDGRSLSHGTAMAPVGKKKAGAILNYREWKQFPFNSWKNTDRVYAFPNPYRSK